MASPNVFYIPGQFWRFTSDGRLENKIGVWKYPTRFWKIPERTGFGFADYIQDNATDEIMGFMGDEIKKGTEIILTQVPSIQDNEKNQWATEYFGNAWFKFTHVSTHLILTAKSSTKLTVEGKLLID